MKKIIMFLYYLLLHMNTMAQNVGIGITSPSQKLHVGNGGVRFEGSPVANGIIPALSIGGYGDVQVDTFGTAGGRFIIRENGKIGIGVTDPQQRLSLKGGMNIDQGNLNNGAIDNNVLRFGDNSGEAIGSGRISGSDNLYGLDFYTGSAKRMVIANSGNVGIGTSNPAFKLDVADRIRIRSGGGFSSAGLYLNNNNNTASPAFIGMHDDNHVGLWGSTAGWGFTMNTDNGALKVNGSEGTSGQVITSNGSGAAGWQSPSNAIYNGLQVFFQTSNVVTAGYADVPGLTQTITTPSCKVLLTIKGNMDNSYCFGCSASSYKFDLVVDNVLVDRNFITVDNGLSGIATNGGFVYNLSSGSHTLSVKIDGQGDTVTGGGYRLVVLVIPQ